MRLEPHWGELDPGIRDVVRSLWNAGYETIASCQGHGHEDAWVTVLPSMDVMLTVAGLRKWLRDRDWHRHAIISAHWPAVEDGEETWVEVRWWGEVPFR